MSLQSSILGLSFGYALLGLLLLLALVRAPLPWLVKAVAVVVTSAFYVLVFFHTQGLLGWSSDDPLPPRFQLLWVRSVEPNIALNEPGAIHMWVEALDDDNLPSGVPRAYRRPYSTALARKVETARTEIASGHPQGGVPRNSDRARASCRRVALRARYSPAASPAAIPPAADCWIPHSCAASPSRSHSHRSRSRSCRRRTFRSP